jgi:hypothetical protein
MMDWKSRFETLITLMTGSFWCYFYLWDYIKQVMLVVKIDTTDCLKLRVRDAVVTPDVLSWVWQQSEYKWMCAEYEWGSQ